MQLILGELMIFKLYFKRTTVEFFLGTSQQNLLVSAFHNNCWFKMCETLVVAWFNKFIRIYIHTYIHTFMHINTLYPWPVSQRKRSAIHSTVINLSAKSSCFLHNLSSVSSIQCLQKSTENSLYLSYQSLLFHISVSLDVPKLSDHILLQKTFLWFRNNTKDSSHYQFWTGFR